MSFDYQRDDINRRVVVTYGGSFHAADAMAILARNRAERVGAYGTLYDLTNVIGHPTVEDLKRFIQEEIRNTPLEGPRGPIALVAADDENYRMACTYAVLGRYRLQIRVFTDRAEAEMWLWHHTKD